MSDNANCFTSESLKALIDAHGIERNNVKAHEQISNEAQSI